MSQVLLVEDNLDIAVLIAMKLESAGHIVTMAHDGPSALKHMTSELPDLVLLDWMIPAPDGLDLCEKLCADQRYDEIPIVMISARAHHDDIERCMAAGANDFITKPFSLRDLSARIDHALASVRPHIGAT